MSKHSQPAFVVVKNATEPEQRMVYAEVYIPDVPDTDGEYMTAEDIRLMAHEFIRSGKMAQVDVQHDGEIVEGAVVVESFIARKGDELFVENSWVVGMHITNDDLWEKIKKNEINGFSMEALVQKDDPEYVEIEVPPIISGLTTKAEDHEHKFYVSFGPDGSFKGGKTDEVNGHSHQILAGTVTEETNGHRHRFAAMDDVRIVN